MAADPAEDMVLVLNGERYVPTGITVIFVGVAGKDTVKQTIKAPTMINHDFGAITITAVVQQAARDVFLNEFSLNSLNVATRVGGPREESIGT